MSDRSPMTFRDWLGKNGPPIAIMTIGFGFIGLMLGFVAWTEGHGAPAMLVFLTMGCGLGAFLGFWGSVEPEER